MTTLGPFHLGPNRTLTNGIYWGDAKKHAQYIPDNSIDLIFTDPVYWQIEDYRWLAELGARVLKPGGMVIAQVGSAYRFEAEAAMRQSSLKPLPLLAEVYPAASYPLHGYYKVFRGWKPYLWFSKGMRKGGYIFDRVYGKGSDKKQHKWGDSNKAMLDWIGRLTDKVGIILDPFTGGGTVPAVCKQLDRRYLAFEIDHATITTARDRVRNTQPPLFVVEPEQLKMDVA
jgi:hypothetical protein